MTSKCDNKEIKEMLAKEREKCIIEKRQKEIENEEEYKEIKLKINEIINIVNELKFYKNEIKKLIDIQYEKLNKLLNY